jgi:hypothetical protein
MEQGQVMTVDDLLAEARSVLVFDAGQPYERFRGRYEATVPPRIRGGGANSPGGTPGSRMSPRTKAGLARTVSCCTGART